MRITYNIVGVLLASALLISCTRKNDVITPPTPPTGGKGGLITLQVTPQHYNKDLNTAKVYIKYGAKTMPAMDSFDDSSKVDFTSGRPIAKFTSLTQGDYYLYAEGKDYDLKPGMEDVYGGAYFHVIDTLEKTYDLYIQLDNPNLPK